MVGHIILHHTNHNRQIQWAEDYTCADQMSIKEHQIYDAGVLIPEEIKIMFIGNYLDDPTDAVLPRRT